MKIACFGIPAVTKIDTKQLVQTVSLIEKQFVTI